MGKVLISSLHPLGSKKTDLMKGGTGRGRLPRTNWLSRAALATAMRDWWGGCRGQLPRRIHTTSSLEAPSGGVKQGGVKQLFLPQLGPPWCFLIHGLTACRERLGIRSCASQVPASRLCWRLSRGWGTWTEEVERAGLSPQVEMDVKVQWGCFSWISPKTPTWRELHQLATRMD